MESASCVCGVLSVEVSATGRSLVQRNSIECVCVIDCDQVRIRERERERERMNEARSTMQSLSTSDKLC
jgi:hypothetical protein